MWPSMVEAILAIKPAAFVAENVPALASKKFARYVDDHIIEPLLAHYVVFEFQLRAHHFGVPQLRRRLFFVGFRTRVSANRFDVPDGEYRWPQLPLGAKSCQTVREAIGLPMIGFDGLAPTIRSGLTGAHHTTSIIAGKGADEAWAALRIWPHGIATDRESAAVLPTKNGHYRMCIEEVALLQGFPKTWLFASPIYIALGQIGNAVPPPMGYAVALAVAEALGTR